MKLWIDTEFNEFRGDLISMALVDEDGRDWYEVTFCEKPGPWVAQHVMPILGQRPIPKQDMQASLSMFLSRYKAVHVIADWPEDIEHFLRLLIVGPGMRLDTPLLTMEVRRDLDNTSETSAVPHNALEDARALRRSHLALNRA